MKNFFVREKKFSKYKSYCIQIYFSKIFLGNIISLDFKLQEYERFWYYIQIGFLGDVFNINTFWDKKSDHAGWTFDLKILGFSIHLNIYDTRHWDYDNDCWEVYLD